MEQAKKPEVAKETVVKEQTPDVQPRVTRENRIPVSGPRDILTISGKDPNYEYRWVNDVPGRIERFLRGGWEYHSDPESQAGQKTVDSASRLGSVLVRNSGGITQVAMRIRKEWYNEDQEAKQAQLDALEDSMRADGGNNRGMEGADRPDTSTFGIRRGTR